MVHAIVILALTPSTSLAKPVVTVSEHGLRALGLENEEVAVLKQAVVDALSESGAVTLIHPEADLVTECKSDTACHCRVARDGRAARALFGNVGRMDRLYTFELVLIDTQSCRVENSVFASETLEEPVAPERIRGLVRRLVTPIESVSETATKSERGVDEVPAVVSVITAAQIHDYGITQVEEIFRLVPGFEMLDANWGGIVLDQGLPNTILLMIDGVPLYDAMNNFRYFGRDFALSVNRLDRVEFVRGPGGVMWGANAFLGVVNFITRSSTRETPQVNAQARYGTLQILEAAEHSRRPALQQRACGREDRLLAGISPA